MAEAYIVAAARTPGGRRKGQLAGWHPADLGAEALNAVIDRSGIDPAAVEDVIMGCVTQGGEQTWAFGRNCVLASKLPVSVPAVTIDRQCGSSQQAVQFAAQAIMSGTQDVIIAAGTESMTRVPLGSNYTLHAQAGIGEGPVSQRIKDRLGITEFSQFVGAQMIADKYGFTREQLDAYALESHRRAAAATREQLDAYALESHRRAAAATQAGAFDAELIKLPIMTEDGPGFATRDEGIRYDASMEGLAGLKTLEEGGVITAGNASQITDGSAAVLIVSEKALKTHGLKPLARIHNFAVTAGDPVIMLEEPIGATRRVLERAGMKIEDMDLMECNEAFASVVLAWLQETGADPAKVNVNGGGIALGHPLGASGAKLMATLVHGLHARGKRWGLQTMCEGGGLANATILEAI
jgi:acetyl-CoA C-acetyltransferase